MTATTRTNPTPLRLRLIEQMQIANLVPGAGIAQGDATNGVGAHDSVHRVTCPQPVRRRDEAYPGEHRARPHLAETVGKLHVPPSDGNGDYRNNAKPEQ